MTDVHIRLATQRDIRGLTALESRYYIGNLDPEEQSDGFVSILHPPQWFARVIEGGGLHVVVTGNGDVAGFMAVIAPPDPAEEGLPAVVRAMLDLTETLEMNGTPIARQRFAVHGPVCIAAQVRGRGLYSALHAVTSKAYRERFDLAVLFVAADNPRSLHTTTTKLGAQSLAVFEADGRPYHFLAFEWGGGAFTIRRSAREVPLPEVHSQHVVDVDAHPVDQGPRLDGGDHLALEQHGAGRPFAPRPRLGLPGPEH